MVDKKMTNKLKYLLIKYNISILQHSDKLNHKGKIIIYKIRFKNIKYYIT